MTSLGQARDMFKLQRQAKKLKKELKNIHVEAEAEGVTVTVSAEQTVISVDIADDVPREKIPERVVDAMNRAFSKAQVVSAEKMRGIMGDMGMATEACMRGMGDS